jgi:PAS domain S-box-containing protein
MSSSTALCIDQLATFLDARLETLLSRWEQSVHAITPPQPPAERLDAMPTLARLLVARLHELGQPDRATPTPSLGAAARRHGAERKRAGFSLAQLARELALFTETVLDLVDESEPRFERRALRPFLDLMADAVAEAAAGYTREQEMAALRSPAHDPQRSYRDFEDAPALVAHLAGPDHVYTFANRRYRQTLPEHALIGRAALGVMPEQSDWLSHELLDQVYREGEPVTARAVPMLFASTHEGTQPALLDLAYLPTRDAHGALDGVLVHAVDITEAERDRREVRRLSGQLETTVLSIAEGVLAIDAAGKITLFNPAAEVLTGWSAGAALGQPVQDVLSLVDAHTGAPLPNPSLLMLRGEASATLGDRALLLRRDGSTIALAKSVSPIRDGERGTVGVVLVFRDDTAAREQDRALRTFRAVMDASSDFIAFGRLGGKPDYVNPAGCALVGLPDLATARATPVLSFFPEHTGESHMKALLATLRGGQPFHADIALRHFETGEIIPVSQSAFAVHDEDNRPLVLATIMRDRRCAERAEAERAELLHAAEAARCEADRQRAYLVEAFTQAPVAVGILSGDNNVVTLANATICRIWGRPSEQVLGRPIFEVVSEVRGIGFEELLAGVRRTGEAFVGREVTMELEHLDGGGRALAILNFVYQPLAVAGQPVSDILIVATDVTAEVEKRRAAEAVSAEFETMFNNMPDGAYLANQSGVLRANPAGLRLFGVDSVEALGLSTAQLLARYHIRDGAGRALAIHDAPLERALQGNDYRGELIIRNASTGQDVRVRAVANPIRVDDSITGAVVVHTDITEQHRSFERLSNSEQELQTLAGVIPQQVWRARADGALDLVNQRVLDYFGVEGEPKLGEAWQMKVHPDDLPTSIARWQSSLQTGEEYETEFRLRRADGTYRWHLSRARPARDASGAVVKWFGTNTDIDESRKTRDELSRRNEFEQHLVGIVSHDLRNPLSVILAGTATLLHMDELSERASKVVTRLHAAAERSSRMIRDLLDFTQARLGHGLSVVRRAGDLYKLTSIALEEVQMAYSDRTIELTRAGNTLGFFDADRMSQVIFNLLTNALNYSDPDTPVLVRVAGQGDAVMLSVHNEGVPISHAQLSRIFEPMQRASDQIDFRTRSVGLGLYIVDALVKAHEGTVQVSSDSEAGTTFTVRLPRDARYRR